MLMLSMFDLCCDYRDFSEAKEKLLDFQRTLITVSPTTSIDQRQETVSVTADSFDEKLFFSS